MLPEEEAHLRSSLEPKNPMNDKSKIVSYGRHQRQTDIQRDTMIRLTGDVWLSDGPRWLYLGEAS